MTAGTTWKPTAEQRELLLDVAKMLDEAAKLTRVILAKMREQGS